MPLDRAIASVTTHAAAAVKTFNDFGTLRPGAPADVTILEMKKGEFEFVDNVDAKRTGREKLVTAAVVMNGKRVRPSDAI
jgi:dihydroorotase